MDDINEESEPNEPTEPTENVDETLDLEVNVADNTEADLPEKDDSTADLVDDTDESAIDDFAENIADDIDESTIDDTTEDLDDIDDGFDETTQDFADARTGAQQESAPPPPPQFAPQEARLSRDPYATFGGVLSGIAHRYGWDVSLTRLAFIVLLIVSGGTAIFAYFLAWLIIPRALHWPPARATRSSSRLSGRDLGIGLIGLGALVVLGIGSGEAAAVLVPLALVGAGIWLLLQSPREEHVTTGTPVPSGTAMSPQPAVVGPPLTAPAFATPVDSQFQIAQPTVAPQPAPKRSRLRRVGIIGLFGFLGLLLLAVIAVPIILIAAITGGDFDFDDETVLFVPATVEDIPTTIVEDAGEIIVDLRAVDFSAETGDTPIELTVDLDVGRIEVLLPEDVRVAVDAENDLGDVTVFGSSSDGFNPSRSVVQNDPQIDIDLDLNVGEIVVSRGSSTTITSTITEVN